MPHSLAARPRFAQGERAIASLVGALTLLVATFAISGSAGATTGKIRAHAAANHAGKHDPGAEAGDQAKNDKKAEDNDAGDENQPPGCDSSYSAAGETHCPPVNQACPVADEGQGNVDEHLGDEAQNDAKAHDAKAKGHRHKGKQDQAKNHKGRKHHEAKNDNVMQHYDQDERDGDAANCVPQPPVCNDGDVKKDGMCVPAEQCQPPNAVRHDACVPPNEACRPGKILKDGTCIPAEDCKVPNTVVNGVCTPPHNPECQPPNTVVNGVCTPPVDNRGCAPSQVLQNGVCVTPAPNTNVAGQAAAPAAGSTPLTTAEPGEAAPAAGVAGTLAASASARLRTQARCGTRTFRVTINGRKIRRITLSVAGRRVRTITMPAGRTSITVSVPVRRFGARRQSVQARVTFRNGATARTLTASATRCAQAAVSPQFTG